jgi:hypothetical protein
MNTDSSRWLDYQQHTLADYYEEVRRKVAVKRWLLRAIRPIVRAYLLNKSHYHKRRWKSRLIPGAEGD